LSGDRDGRGGINIERDRGANQASTHAASNAFTGPQVKPEVAGVAILRIESTPDVLLTAATGSLLAAAGFFVVRRHGTENLFCRLPLNDEGKFSIVSGRCLLITQVTRIDG
jgi:hypothetical protein